MEAGERERGDVRPDPDPTRLSAALVHREVEQLRREMAAQREIIEERFRTMEERHRTICVRIDALDQRFEQMDDMRRELKSDHQRSLDQALDTQRQETAKLEATITRSFAEHSKTQAADSKRLEEQIQSNRRSQEELGQRVVGVEERNVGARTDRSGVYAGVGAVAVLALIVLEIVQLVVG